VFVCVCNEYNAKHIGYHKLFTFLKQIFLQQDSDQTFSASSPVQTPELVDSLVQSLCLRAITHKPWHIGISITMTNSTVGLKFLKQSDQISRKWALSLL